jgi:hypothetical protein
LTAEFVMESAHSTCHFKTTCCRWHPQMGMVSWTAEIAKVPTTHISYRERHETSG